MGNQAGKYHQDNLGGKPKKNVHWKSAERPSPPGRPMLVALSDQQPDVVSLRWDRPKIDGGSPIIGYMIEHRRMGSPHWVRATPIPVTLCEASISGLEPGWRYQFRAFAENIVGRSEPSELSDPLTVTLHRNAISVPRFLDELQDVNAVEDERIEFRVRFLGQPTPEISWFKDGYEIFSSRRTKIVNDNDASVLIIHQVALTDEGEIRCTATNRAGHVVTKAQLMVEAPPKIRLPRTYEDGLIVEAGETVRLKVGIAGHPVPHITWRHEGDVIPSDDRFEIIHTDKNSLLKIDNIQRNDRGEFSIRASNKLGDDSASFLVTVTARPNPPGRVRLNMSFGKSATLSWTSPIDDGGCKIGNYIVEYFRVGWNVWLKATTTRLLSTTLNDLIEGSEYKFRVKAENPYGLSDPSEESDVLFIPDPKRGITKPKSATKLADIQNKPVPPRRKTLSPSPRPPQQDAATETPKPRKAQPQLIDSEDLHRAMSYGTPDNVLRKEVRRSPSTSYADSSHTVQQTSYNLYTEAINSPEKSPPRSPRLKSAAVPSERSPPVPTKSILKSRVYSPERTERTPEVRMPELSFRKSSSPQRPDKKHTFRKSPTPEAELRQQSGRRLSDNQLSLVRDAPAVAIAIALGNLGNTSTNNNDSNNTEVVKRENGLRNQNSVINNDHRTEETSGTTSLLQQTNQNNPDYRPEDGEKNKKNRNGRNLNEDIGPMSPNTNPSIEISAPTPAANLSEDPLDVRSPSPVSPLSERGKHDEVHTSNEFMLVVFDKNSKVKEKDKQDSFELDLEDAIQPPPISISTPDLASLEFNNLHSLPLRRSVSSTELLYERAMARFYEAVELEEAEKARKLKISQQKILVPSTNAPTTIMRKRLGSMTEAERLSFERRSELRRQSAEIVHDFKMPTKWSSRENIAIVSKPLSRVSDLFLGELDRQESLEDADDLSDSYRATPNAKDSYDLGSDYTESTASSEEDSIEHFKMELMARTHSPKPRELETYHPRSMAEGVFTPYRGPTPEQAVVVLSRPSPLPSPDFVPKPILKRPSNENMISESSPPPPAPNGGSNEKSRDLTKGLKSFFKRDKKSATDVNTEENEKEQSKPTKTAIDMEAKRRNKEEEERKRLEAERIMREEAKAAADHYSELVQQVSSSHKYHTPLYLDREELKKAAVRAAKEGGTVTGDEEDDLSPITDQQSSGPALIASKAQDVPKKPRFSVSERNQAKRNVPNDDVPNDLLDQKHKERSVVCPEEEKRSGSGSSPMIMTTEITAPEVETNVVRGEAYPESPEIRGRTRIVKVKRIIKRRVPSGTRSRETSGSRPPSSLAPPTPDIVEPMSAEQQQQPVRQRQRISSRTRSAVRGESKSPAPRNRSAVLKAVEDLPSNESKGVSPVDRLSNGQLLEMNQSQSVTSAEAHEKVRSAVSYSTDMVLFIVACYVYLFKDARLVLPILVLLIYRQLGELLSAHLPHWMKRKKD